MRDQKPIHSPKKQLAMLPKAQREYGGIFRRKAKGRGARPLSSTQVIHLIMKSTKATGARSFISNHNLIAHLIRQQARKNHITVVSWANVGNHLHIVLRLPRIFRPSYAAFIRALSGVIALRLMKANKTHKVVHTAKDRFWDLRPYTRVLTSWREVLNLRHYVRVNELEGLGFDRNEAKIRAQQRAHDDG